jgi:hypothetical protein
MLTPGVPLFEREITGSTAGKGYEAKTDKKDYPTVSHCDPPDL